MAQLPADPMARNRRWYGGGLWLKRWHRPVLKFHTDTACQARKQDFFNGGVTASRLGPKAATDPQGNLYQKPKTPCPFFYTAHYFWVGPYFFFFTFYLAWGARARLPPLVCALAGYRRWLSACASAGVHWMTVTWGTGCNVNLTLQVASFCNLTPF